MMDDKVVKAEVKLAFKSVAGDSMICSRTMQMAVTRTKATFKSLEGQLLMKRGDTRSTISTKCSELDEQVPLALGVPKAILEYVIFCHQEESLWPLSEPAALKKRFDDIFQASQFTKALDQIKSQRKEMATDIKLLEQSVNHLQQDKERAERTEERLKAAENTIEKYEAEADTLREELSDVVARSDELFKTNQEFQEILSHLETLKHNERSIDDQIKRVLDPTEWLPDSDEELQYKIANFQQLIRAAEQDLSNLKDELLGNQQQLKRLRTDLNDTAGKEGLLKAQENDYHDNLTTRFETSQLVQNELNIELEDEDFIKLETRLMRIVNDHDLSLNRLATKCKDEDAVMSQKIKLLSDSRLKETQHKEYALSDIKTTDTQIKETQSKINNLDVNEGDIEYQKTSLTDLETKLAAFRLSNPIESLLSQIKSNNAKISSLENEIEELNKEISKIHKQSDVHAKISLLSQEKKHKEAVLSSLAENHKALLEKFQISLEKPINSLKCLTESTQSKLQTEITQLGKLNKNLNNIENIVQYKQDALNQHQSERQKAFLKIQDQLEEGDSVDDYQEILESAESDYKNALENLKMRSTTLDFNRKALAYAEQELSCYLCKRKFEDDSILSLFISELKLRTNPESETVLKEQLHDAQGYLNQIRDVAPDVKNVEALDGKIAKLEKELADSKRSLEIFQKKESEQKVIVDTIKAEFEGLEELRNPVNEITRLQNDVKSLEFQLDDMKTALIGFGFSSRSLEELQDEQVCKSEALKSLRRNISSFMEEKESKQRELASLEGGVKDLRLNISNLERSLIERENLKHAVKDMKAKAEKLREEVSKSDVIISEIESELHGAEIEFDSLRQEHEYQLSHEKQKLEVERDYYNNIRTLNDKINKFLNHDIKLLEQTREAIKKLKSEIEIFEQECSKLSEEIAEETSKLQNSSNQERILKGNIEIRHLQNELNEVQHSISEIDVDKAHSQRAQYIEESEQLSHRQSEINAELAGKMGEMRQISDQVNALKRELSTDFKDVKELYRKEWVKLQVLSIHSEDLLKYSQALDNAIMNYHAMKMKEINKIIDELWKTTYKGTDVDTISIESEPAKASATGMARSYNYRVVMIKQNVKLDMRGRCSAGQKVLASIIIRLALSECFGTNCGVIALDEPTTNLDAENIESLAKSLAAIIEIRKRQNNFQLIVITHDEKFLVAMQASKYTSHFYRISRDQSQKSRIESVDINKIVD